MSTHVVGRRREGYCLLPPHLFHGEQPVVSQNIGGVSIAPPPCLRPLSPYTGEVTQRPGNCAGGGGGQERSAMANSKGRVRQHGPKPFTSLFFSPPFSTPRAAPTLLPILLPSSAVCVENVTEDLGEKAVKMSTNDNVGQMHPRFQLSARPKSYQQALFLPFPCSRHKRCRRSTRLAGL